MVRAVRKQLCSQAQVKGESIVHIDGHRPRFKRLGGTAKKQTGKKVAEPAGLLPAVQS